MTMVTSLLNIELHIFFTQRSFSIRNYLKEENRTRSEMNENNNKKKEISESYWHPVGVLFLLIICSMTSDVKKENVYITNDCN